MQLSLNDGSDATTPLYLTLSTRTRFSTRMQALGEAVAAGKGLSQMNMESVFEEYESEEVVNDEEHLEVANTEDALIDNAAPQEDGITQQQEEPSDEVSTHNDALTTADTDDTNQDHILTNDAPAEVVDEHGIINAQEEADTSNTLAAEATVNLPEPHDDDFEEVEEVHLQVDDGVLPLLEGTQPAATIHDDDILDLEEEHENDEDGLEDIPAVDDTLEEVDNEDQGQTQSHIEGLSDHEDDFDDNLDGDDTANEPADQIEIAELPTAKRSRPEDEDNVDVPAKKQQLASHHVQLDSATTPEK